MRCVFGPDSCVQIINPTGDGEPRRDKRYIPVPQEIPKPIRREKKYVPVPIEQPKEVRREKKFVPVPQVKQKTICDAEEIGLQE